MTHSFAESEYSPEAEAAYAEFVAAGATDDAEFEELCERHPDLADELEGLHADFAGVAGVLARVRERLRGEEIAMPEAETVLARTDAQPSIAEEPDPAPAPATFTVPAARPGRGAALALGLFAALAVGFAGFAWWIHREGERQRQELAARVASESARAGREAARAEEEAASREQAEDQARRAAELALAAEGRAAHGQRVGRLARIQARIGSGDLARATEDLGSGRPAAELSWEERLLEGRLAERLGERALGELVEAVFRPLDGERLGRAAAAAWEARGPRIDGDPGGATFAPRVDVEGPGGARRLEVQGRLLRVLDPAFEEPLLELPLPRDAEGIAVSGERLRVRFRDGSIGSL